MKTLPQDIRSVPPLPSVAALLREANLPSADIRSELLEYFFYSGAPLEPTGIVGLEPCGTDALLRSLVVTPANRSIGIGAILLGHAERYARTRGIDNLYLLTTTAEAYFSRHGYQRIEREQAPPAIRATAEFESLCPASATLMVKHL